ncbi:T9SS type A sorting domain-containing protein [Polaribacter porphyrae]|uniref:Secretion system C-terminal sorting domain-containing protein n=1 Tax=Polaribacter porphyrae TaxID=1137780 RepID=A0A2S7WLU9_9FLAO|nr:T9SS type A sorting domain-containing protein [Polaribacter porphyrae]PQJ78549.1 hypothetical protein BTO18_04820 [Polaribacter porphyrae]
MKKIILFFTLFSLNYIQAQALLVKDIQAGSTSSMPTYTENRVDINGNLLFTVYNSTTDDYHLWNTDGTESGTKLMKPFVDYQGFPAHAFTYSSTFDRVFFGAIESCTGFRQRMFSTDGTITNTNLLSGNFSFVKEITNFNNNIYYYASTLSGLELAYFDGTSQNIIDVNPGTTSSFPRNLKAIGNKLYFAAEANTNEGIELCMSDGTATGTIRLKNININGDTNNFISKHSLPQDFIGYNNKVYFTADNAINGRELWVTDGTETNTKMITDMHPGANDSFYVAPNFTVYKNELYFTGFTPATGVELYKMNANETITNVLDINPGGANHSYPKDLFVFDGKLFFSADDGTNGYELWYTQNTGATSKSTNAITTALFKNINTIATESSNPTNFIAFDGKMYFTADNGTNGIELWESDGSVGGTKLKQDINPTGDSNPRDFIVSNNLLYFSADDGTNGDELWKFSNNFIIGSLSPNDDAIDMALSGENLKITLNKEIVKGTGNIIIYKSSDDSVFETINVNSSNVTINSNTAVINPTLNFSAAEDYYVFIDNGALKDGRNNSFTGIADKTIWNFKTAGVQNQTITFNTLPNKIFGDADFQLTATTSSNLSVSYTSSNTNVVTISGNTVTIIGAGSTIITASQSGDANFSAAPNVTQTLTINKANQTISFGQLPDRTFGDADFQLTATSNSNLPVTYLSSNTNVATLNGNIVTIVGAGSTNITASQSGNTNYSTAQDVTETLTVKKGIRNVTINPIPTKTFGDPNFFINSSVDGIPQNDNTVYHYYAGNSNISIDINTGEVSINGTGTFGFTVDYIETANYLANQANGSFIVQKADQSITFNILPDKAVGDADFSLTATSSANLPITYSSSDTNVATVNGNIVSIVAMGNTTITASQNGNTNYNAAVDVTQNLTVTATASTKDFESIGVKLYPNPTSGLFSLIHTTDINSIIIYNTLGQKIKEFINPKESVFIIRELKKGIYMIKIKNEKGTATSKIIKI